MSSPVAPHEDPRHAEPYDSTADTLKHIRRVQALLGDMAIELIRRGQVHDESKLGEMEKPIFDRMTPMLKTLQFGSPEYQASLKEMGPALKHHYEHNSHHPEHYPGGINDFDILDLVEMLCDWKAASERTKDGDIRKSISINMSRYTIDPQIAQIFSNTARRQGWAR